jgi:hypothetical protein
MVEQLRARYRDRALAPDTLFLLNANDAIEFLDEAHSAGLVLAGVEGFLVTDAGAYQPRQDFSNDMADFEGSGDRFVEETKNLVRQGASVGIRFQIVFEEAA